MRPSKRGGRRFAVLLAAAIAVSGVGLTHVHGRLHRHLHVLLHLLIDRTVE